MPGALTFEQSYADLGLREGTLYLQRLINTGAIGLTAPMLQ